MQAMGRLGSKLNQVVKLTQNLNKANRDDTLQKRLRIILMGGTEELRIHQAVERTPKCVL